MAGCHGRDGARNLQGIRPGTDDRHHLGGRDELLCSSFGAFPGLSGPPADTRRVAVGLSERADGACDSEEHGYERPAADAGLPCRLVWAGHLGTYGVQ